MGVGNVILKIITAFGGLYSTTHMGTSENKQGAIDMAIDKGSQFSDPELQKICSVQANYLYEKGEGGEHIVTCTLPLPKGKKYDKNLYNEGSRGGRNMLGIKSKKTKKKRKPAKKSKKTKKRKTKSLKKKRKQTKKRKTRRN